MPTEQTATPNTGDLETILAAGQRRQRETEAPLVKGSTAGRYFVLDHIGSGGMGDVYAAYDPQLDRRIALKLMRRARSDGAHDGGVARMMREAKAMAKVSHPNVIAVFDVGTLEGRVFLAMEFVDGCNLEEWLSGAKRGWDEVRDVFVLAGRGLAAAHASGLVHRDFKPANVLVDKDGGVRVADFGLAFGGEEDPRSDVAVEFTEASTSSSRSFLNRLTATGTTMGTPAYMSPEQHATSSIDARSDQFSYCVALFEAWFGRRPFSGDTFHALAASVCAGEIESPPNDARIPGSLRRALAKGLSVAPADRFASMDALLQALAPPKREKRSLAVVAAVGAAALASGATWVVFADPPPACDDGVDQLGTAWDPARRRAVDLALRNSGASHAEATADRVVSTLDAYAAQWIDGYQDACAATHVRGQQSETALDLRLLCLGQKRAALEGLGEALVAGHEKAVNLAVDAASGLPEIGPCSNTEGLLLGAPPPAAKQQRDRLTALEASLHRANALSNLGEAPEAEVLGSEIVAAAREIGYAPFLGRALAGLGSFQAGNGKEKEGEETLVEALEESIAAGDDREVARVASRLVYVSSQRTERFEAADVYYRLALASQRRLGSDDELRASLLINYGQSLSARGRSEEGLALIDEAVEIRRRTSGDDSLDYARARLASGTTLNRLGRVDDLGAVDEEVAAIYHARYGEDHPKSLGLLRRRGVVSLMQGNFPEARDRLLRAIEFSERALGPNHIEVIDSRGNLSLAYAGLGQWEKAVVEGDVVLAKYEEAYGETAQLGEWLINRGTIEHSRGRLDDARSYFERARTIFEGDPTRAGHLGAVLSAVSGVELGTGNFDKALELAVEGYRLLLAGHGTEHPRTHTGLITVLHTLLVAGRREEAQEVLDGATDVIARFAAPDNLAAMDFVRARLIGAKDPKQAKALAMRARDVLAGPAYHFASLVLLADIDAWLTSIGADVEPR